ncbi:MAG TPA: FAD-binding protein [Thermoleophilaceae bacterium]|jgi:succinate dehydrogenase/fumarate reductase flavoprotein subunit
MADLVVAGAGMAGLVAATRARELGAAVELFEKGERPGGSMLLSSGFVWRHRDFDAFRAECPGGDPELQRLVYERLDHGLDWLERLGAPVSERETGNPLTVGRRFDTRALTELFVARAGPVRVGEPLRELPDGVPVLLATGGFQGDRSLVREHVTPEAGHLLLRANPWSSGDGLRLGMAAGASASEGMGEFYGRNMPAPPATVKPEDFVPLAQLYARHARVENERGETFETRTWSEIDAVQWTARQPGARARYVIPDTALGERVRERTVADMVAAAEGAGGRVERGDGVTSVDVVAAITTTLGGLRIDPSARAADGVFAAGADAGGISTGGYSSGLAAALVFGLIAAESALA